MGLNNSKSAASNDNSKENANASANANGNGIPVAIAQNEVIASTKYGKIAGKQFQFDGIDGRANAFLGIPFASPPIGQLRFKKPQPPEPWTGVRQTKTFPPQCPQKVDLFVAKFMRMPSSEDCLYLNVFAPAPTAAEASTTDPPSKLLPVIVFIHGGAFVMGQTQTYGDKGICRHFVLEQNCVFVTIQYRVALFGFFSTGDDACDDNAALWDMTMALEWVQENIAQFGGDKQNVTVMGQSAGGVAVDLLALSPHSRDLFHKVIPMAGNSNCHWAFDDNLVEKCRRIAHDLGIYTRDSAKMIEMLRQMPANKLALGLFNQDKNTDPNKRLFGDFKCPLAPRMDGKFFPKSLEELRAEAPPKPRMIGVCQLESLFFMMIHHKSLEGLLFPLSKVQEIIARTFPESKFPGNFGQLRKKALELYLAAAGENGEKMQNDKVAQMQALAEIFSDMFTGIGTQQCVLQQLGHSSNSPAAPIFLYTFDYCNPRHCTMLSWLFNGKWPIEAAPCHSSEICYIFRNVDLNLFGYKSLDQKDEKLIGIVTKMWANFAKYGDPNGCKDVPESQLEGFQWEQPSVEHPGRHLSIKLAPEMAETFQGGRPLAWIELSKDK